MSHWSFPIFYMLYNFAFCILISYLLGHNFYVWYKWGFTFTFFHMDYLLIPGVPFEKLTFPHWYTKPPWSHSNFLYEHRSVSGFSILVHQSVYNPGISTSLSNPCSFTPYGRTNSPLGFPFKRVSIIFLSFASPYTLEAGVNLNK